MRLSLLSLVLLAAACSREPAPSQAKATSALPPGPDASIAQAVPAGGVPAPGVQPAGQSDPGIPAAALAAPRNDPRWRDVNPSELPEAPAEVVAGKEKNPELSQFEDEQRRRDAELMAQDAEEAQRNAGRVDEREPRDERYARDERERMAGDGGDWRDSDRYRRYAEQRERYRGQDSRDAGDNDYPPDELDPYAQPEPWDEIPEGPEQDEDYDPEAGQYYQR